MGRKRELKLNLVVSNARRNCIAWMGKQQWEQCWNGWHRPEILAQCLCLQIWLLSRVPPLSALLSLCPNWPLFYLLLSLFFFSHGWVVTEQLPWASSLIGRNLKLFRAQPTSLCRTAPQASPDIGTPTLVKHHRDGVRTSSPFYFFLRNRNQNCPHQKGNNVLSVLYSEKG